MDRAAKRWMHELMSDPAAGIKAIDMYRVLGYFETRAIMTIHGKKSRTRRHFATLQDIGKELISD
eukprot:7494525-Pyramimonas_sp.AAC.1